MTTTTAHAVVVAEDHYVATHDPRSAAVLHVDGT